MTIFVTRNFLSTNGCFYDQDVFYIDVFSRLTIIYRKKILVRTRSTFSLRRNFSCRFSFTVSRKNQRRAWRQEISCLHTFTLYLLAVASKLYHDETQ